LSEKKRFENIYSAFFKQEFPADLALVIVWLIISIAAIYLPLLSETPIRIVFVIPLVLFVPGYCFVAALFPKKDEIGLIERILLSIGVSIAVVSLMGLGLNFTPLGIRLYPIIISLTIITYVMILVAYYQRAILPETEQFRIPFFTIAGGIRQEVIQPGKNSIDRFLSVVLALILIIAIITTVFVIVAPKEGGERFTEFYILGETQMATYYPTQIIPGQNYPMYVGVGNHENRNTTYTVETWLLHTEFDNVTNSSRIITMDPKDRLSFTLAHNQTLIIPYNLSVKETGYDRVEFLLFNESIPGFDVNGKDRINASLRELHLWVTTGVVEEQDT